MRALLSLCATLNSASAESWAGDFSTTLGRSSFVKLGCLVATKDAYDISTSFEQAASQELGGGASIPPLRYYDKNSEVCGDSGNECEFVSNAATTVNFPSRFSNFSNTVVRTSGANRNILMDRWLGAAHGYCFSLKVTEEPQLDFRVCTMEEIAALGSVIPLPRGHILGYASSDGNDMDGGVVKFAKDLERMDNSGNTVALGKTYMQSFQGADDEFRFDRAYSGDRFYSYCCSNAYTIAMAEGATR